MSAYSRYQERQSEINQARRFAKDAADRQLRAVHPDEWQRYYNAELAEQMAEVTP